MKKINIPLIFSFITISLIFNFNATAQGLVIEQGTDVNQEGYAIIGKPLGLHIALSNANIQGKASEGSYADLRLNFYGGDVEIARSEAGGNANVFIGATSTNKGLLNAYNTLFVNGETDRVGIGIENPNAKLSVQGGDIAINNIIPGMRLFATDATTQLAQISSFVGALFIQNQFTGATADILIQTENGSLRLEDDGKFGIRIETPSHDVHIQQSSITTTGTGGMMFQSNASTDGWKILYTENHFSFIDRVGGDNTRRAYVEDDTGDWVQPSDKNLKTSIKKIEHILPKVNLLEPVSYRYKSKNNNSTRTLGFLAQDVEKVLPELVHYGENGELGLAYGEFAVIAIRAIQEQQIILEQQEQKKRQQQDEINYLQSTVENQNQRINHLEQQLAKINQFIENQSSTVLISNEIHQYEMILQKEVFLGQNYPNPFNEQTSIDFFIPTAVKKASLLVTTTEGKLLQKLNIEERGKGQVNLNIKGLASGIYFYNLIVDGQQLEARKMVLER